MAKTVSIDVIDKSIPSDNTRNIPIINQPNPCKGYAATAKEVAQLIQLASYYVYAAGTTNVIDGYTFYDYFPEEGGSSSGGGLSRTEIQAMIDASIPTLDTAMSSTSRNGVENRVIKEFVNSSIASSTGTFRGTFDSLDELNAYSGEKKNNDYAYVATKDAAGLSSKQSKYKYVADTDTWTFEYDINNTTFTAAQTAAINSGITDTDVAKITSNETAINELNTKVANHEDTMTKAAAHIIDKKNPHEVTKAQIGLGDVDNTSDMEKPISTLTQAALNKKLDIDSDIVKNSHTHANKEVIDKLSVNDNDELLYNDKKIGADATVVDDALSTTSTNAIANKAVATKINEVEKTITDHVADVENPHNVTKAQIGLDKVDNTADADKPISALTQSALDTKVDKVDGKQLSTNDFTDVEKTQIETNKTDIDILKTSSHTHDNKEVIDKFSADANGKLLYDGAEVGGSSPITVDSELSETSTNPVQNKTITTRINEVENKIPTNVSVLTNDSEYQTKSDVTTILADYAKTTDIPTVDVTKEYVDTALNGKADVDHAHTTVNGHTVESDVPADAKFTDTVYDDTAIKELINSKIDETTLVDYAKKADLKTKLSEFENDSEFITNTVDNLTNYYLKTETYTQDEVNNLISNINKITVEVVAELPAENISASTIYLILIDTEKNVYSQNMYINEKWAVLGSTSVDLTGYVKSDELTTKLEAYATNESVETHTSNNDIHVTTDEKTSWNNAVTTSHSHENKTIIDKITTDDTGKLLYDGNSIDSVFARKLADLFIDDAEWSTIGSEDTILSLAPGIYEVPNAATRRQLGINDIPVNAGPPGVTMSDWKAPGGLLFKFGNCLPGKGLLNMGHSGYVLSNTRTPMALFIDKQGYLYTAVGSLKYANNTVSIDGLSWRSYNYTKYPVDDHTVKYNYITIDTTATTDSPVLILSLAGQEPYPYTSATVYGPDKKYDCSVQTSGSNKGVYATSGTVKAGMYIIELT